MDARLTADDAGGEPTGRGLGIQLEAWRNRRPRNPSAPHRRILRYMDAHGKSWWRLSPLLALLVLGSCSEMTDPAPTLIGDWESVDDIPATLARLEFQTGGKLLVKVPYQGAYRVIEGTWTREGDFLTMTIPDPDSTVVLLVEAKITTLTNSRFCWIFVDGKGGICYKRKRQ